MLKCLNCKQQLVDISSDLQMTPSPEGFLHNHENVYQLAQRDSTLFCLKSLFQFLYQKTGLPSWKLYRFFFFLCISKNAPKNTILLVGQRKLFFQLISHRQLWRVCSRAPQHWISISWLLEEGCHPSSGVLSPPSLWQAVGLLWIS